MGIREPLSPNPKFVNRLKLSFWSLFPVTMHLQHKNANVRLHTFRPPENNSHLVQRSLIGFFCKKKNGGIKPILEIEEAINIWMLLPKAIHQAIKQDSPNFDSPPNYNIFLKLIAKLKTPTELLPTGTIENDHNTYIRKITGYTRIYDPADKLKITTAKVEPWEESPDQIEARQVNRRIKGIIEENKIP